ncbi:multi-copper polyphenol oxidoreductase laccase [Campylobacter pinnipediorum subsp. pinnipediorum]|uniref:peptidoglycan editing factor PgeF n=1 Tax=Campylobacter pinnipediorum TaxID=1965231 RepID=UPI00084D7261|nr:peptidoglycan editing factor PgeF [Campylobacter pinnipediorum]AQW81243.1 multi-copper polyphenol oxidoreductase laccase [Campylobacter pinnipediorum subsp. pinnipediorum]AQW84547.1 multi-copper polyphenol oxidoreductase laccase [Campylobacter pinnipediorum subsp. pinnipediorum]OPA78190.1 multicopper polyphenol oxidase [Campylobacter pinnipediorum subsp. pinnipediorum]
MGKSRQLFEFVLNDKNIIAGFSTRFGGVSDGAYSCLNLGLHTGDNTYNVLKNREVLRNFLCLQKLIFVNQIHSDEVKILKDKEQILGDCDGIITNLKNIGICVMVADCSPILIYDSKNSVIACIHAGRQGVIKKILTKCVIKMQENFNSNVSDLSVFVGPNIKGSCYEVGDLDLKEFNEFKIGNKFDMNLALKNELISLGVNDFSFNNTCAHCDNRYFSYRRDKITGRFAGIIALR